MRSEVTTCFYRGLVQERSQRMSTKKGGGGESFYHLNERDSILLSIILYIRKYLCVCLSDCGSDWSETLKLRC